MPSSRKIWYSALIIAAAAAIACAARYFLSDKESEYTFSGFYFDTAVTCKIISADDSLADECKSRVRLLDEAASAYNESSAVYKINHGENFSAEKYPEIAEMLEGYKTFEENFGEGITPFCGNITFLWNVSSDSPRVPSDSEIEEALKSVKKASAYDGSVPEDALIDLGAGAKGYACDKLLEEAFAEASAKEIVFSTGSSSLMWSREGRSFTAAVTDPENGGTALEFTCESSFVSTSGGYERYFEENGEKYVHIMDMETGRPVKSDIASATVVLPCDEGNGMASDLLSTLIFMGGTEKAESYSEICGRCFSDYGIIIIDNNGGVISYGNVNIK